VGFVTAATVVA
jgi:hypothetical protein